MGNFSKSEPAGLIRNVFRDQGHVLVACGGGYQVEPDARGRLAIRMVDTAIDQCLRGSHSRQALDGTRTITNLD